MSLDRQVNHWMKGELQVLPGYTGNAVSDLSTCLVWDCNTSEGCLEDQGVGYPDSLHGSVRHVHSISIIRVTYDIVYWWRALDIALWFYFHS